MEVSLASSFAWLDYSEQERQRMLEVVELFSEKNTVDELGIGAVRDAYANLLFPGTTTIQTRASYFLFVPWIYQLVEKTHPDDIAVQARRLETTLIGTLIKSDDNRRTIGMDARDRLKRLASNVYWQGLAVWGIRTFPGSQDQYHRTLKSSFTSRSQALRADDGDIPEGQTIRNWHAGLPPIPEGFPNKGISHRLAEIEATYLRERVMANCPGSLLAFILDNELETKDVEFPWDHDHVENFTAPLRNQLLHARNFSEVIHGAALLYNLMLAEKAKSIEMIENYGRRLEDWRIMIVNRQTALVEWDRQQFWTFAYKGNARITNMTRTFIAFLAGASYQRWIFW